MKQYLLIATVILLAAGPILAQAEPAAVKPAPKPPAKAAEVMRNAVDPYVPAVERARFFIAAGKDNELTAAEFTANRKHAQPFVRPFDHWPMLIGFDKNSNKTIDWFEAAMYRREVRTKVMAEFDITKDRKLRGAERDKANTALANEKWLAARKARSGPRPVFVGEYEAGMVRRYDTDKDGQISDAERRAAFAQMREQGRRQMLARYDRNNDGELDEDERAAMRNQQQQPWQAKIREWQLRDYDLNNDGELDVEETAELRDAEAKFQTTMRAIGKRFEARIFDINGDGDITPEERTAVGQKMQGMAFKAMGRLAKYADSDGDGAASPQEWMDFRNKAGTKVMTWMEGYGLRYDKNDDGRLDARERDTLMKGLSDDIDARMAKADGNKDGHLEGDELLDMAEGFLQEVGLGPKERDRKDDGRRD